MDTQLLLQLQPTGQALELACGTSLWTQQLLGAAPEVLRLNQQRLQSATLSTPTET